MLYQIFSCVPARTRQLVPFVQGARSRFAYDVEFLCYAKITSLCYIWIRPGASHYFPGYSKFRFGVTKEIEGIKKDICKVFRNIGLKITIEANKKIVNFLDVTLNLDKGSYEPFAKPSNTPLYVHRESNHPHSILKSIPLAINKRLSEVSSNKESFDKAAPLYQQALEKSGYKHQLKFDATSNTVRREADAEI